MGSTFNPENPQHIYRALHLFAGIGGGSLGFKQARFDWRGVPGQFENVLAIDSDPGACESYRKITGSRAECWDLFSREQYVRFHGNEPPDGWAEIAPIDIYNACGCEAPDVVFTSPPCKGLSGLLPQASAKLDRYQALNDLTVRGIKLILDAFPDKPVRVFLLENVPRIKSRGKHLLDEIVALLRSYGYAVDMRDHDCGALGGLGQRRKRFLLIARHQESLQPFIYQPPVRPLKSIGDVIGRLPLPDAPEMGKMHRLPRLKWLTWLRLALIPAGGAGGVLLQKPKVKVEVYNDLDRQIANVFRVMRDPGSRLQLTDLLIMTPYHREEFELSAEESDDPIEQARRTIIRAHMGFGSAGATKGNTGFRSDSRRSYGTASHLWAKYPEQVQSFGERLAGVIIENRSAIDVISMHDDADTLFYCDPPYLLSTRSHARSGAGKYYSHEMSDPDHEDLLTRLRSLEGFVVLSGYPSELYSDLLVDWSRHQTSARISAGRGTTTRTECLWTNPRCADAQKQMSFLPAIEVAV